MRISSWQALKKHYREEEQDGLAGKELAIKHEDMSSIPRIHMEEGENQLLQVGL